MIRFIIAMMFVGSVYADNEIYIDQSGDNVSIDLEQLGSSNMIGGLQSVNGSMTKACLLYTSPSPRDRTRSRMPSSA